jgi:hypothetical protein
MQKQNLATQTCFPHLLNSSVQESTISKFHRSEETERNGVYCHWFCFVIKSAVSEIGKNEELITFFTFTAYSVFDITRTTWKTLCPKTYECNVTWRLKAGMVDPEETTVPRQRLGRRVPAATNAHAWKLLEREHTHSQQSGLISLFSLFQTKENRLQN